MVTKNEGGREGDNKSASVQDCGDQGSGIVAIRGYLKFERVFSL